MNVRHYLQNIKFIREYAKLRAWRAQHIFIPAFPNIGVPACPVVGAPFSGMPFFQRAPKLACPDLACVLQRAFFGVGLRQNLFDAPNFSKPI